MCYKFIAYSRILFLESRGVYKNPFTVNNCTYVKIKTPFLVKNKKMVD